MTKDEALKMAIEAMERAEEVDWELNSIHVLNILQAIQACKEALEQPAQEPVAWNEEEFNAIAYAYRSCPAHEIEMISECYQDLVDYVLSITHPAPSWQGLSDDEVNDLHHKWIMNSDNKDTQYDFARAIEQAVKDKNS